MSEREPELGIGLVAAADGGRVTIDFPATRERRIYALGTPVLKRVQFRVGETVTTRDGASFPIEAVTEESGLLVYAGHGRRVREDAISDVNGASSPLERLLAGHTDPGEVFDLRQQALQVRARLRSSAVRGFLGGRVDLIPHQFYILNEVSSRQLPRVLLADEVGLGKTIEACLILQRLLAVGKVRRALVLVPESLTHQWFVELLRRFNLWFTIYDEERCVALEQSDPEQNPFAASQLGLASVTFLAGNERRRDQAIAAEWDLVIVDEAHHLGWSPEAPGAEYRLVEALAQRSPGLLLLTATPTQLGLTGHFARLRLLDPARYHDYDAFLAETERYGAVASVAEKIVDGKPLLAKDRTTLRKIFTKDPERLAGHLDALAHGQPGAREALLNTLLDQHGTGRVMFRNTRAAMHGFPKRKFCPAPLDAENNVTLLARIARELHADETGAEATIRYSFKDDPRLDWLVAFLKAHAPAKVLLICRSPRKVLALAAALQEKTAAKVGLFHEGLPLVQRDRQAAWFAEPDGAQLLICSEIGSEGRNFQFAHHLVLFDLPLNPGLIEQRIGRLDRIGQTETIRIHVPFVAGSAEACVVAWYQDGLHAFETSLHGGTEFEHAFKERLLALALAFGASGGTGKVGKPELDAFLAETAAFRAELAQKLKRGRDRLLELHSFNHDAAERILGRVRAADDDPALRRFLYALLEHFGVQVREHELGEVFLDPSHAFIAGFPSIPADGMLATFDRRRAIAREDIRFLSADHALVQDAIDLLIDAPTGSTTFGTLAAEQPNLLLEAVFVLETVADSRWHVDQFLAPTPVRVVIDARRNDLTEARPAAAIASGIEDADLHRFLEQRGFDAGVLKTLLAGAEERAAGRSESLKAAAEATAATALGADLQRLVDLRRLNDAVRPEEIALAQQQIEQTRTAIRQARLRLDSLRLVLERPRAGT